MEGPARLRPAALTVGADLPGAGQMRGVLAVVAHPDDESFGLGAVIGELVQAAVRVSVLCFTHGEASTLHGCPGDLREVREAELRAAGAELRVGRVELLGYPDGELSRVPMAELAGHVLRMIGEERPSHLLAFDIHGGVTGHADHVRATEAALAAARESELPVLAWAIPEIVAKRLNAEFGSAFSGRPPTELDVELTVSRAAQQRAIARHVSQATENPVLRRRLELLDEREYLRVLSTPGRGERE